MPAPVPRWVPSPTPTSCCVSSSADWGSRISVRPTPVSFNVPSVRASGSITIERGAGKTVEKTFSRAGGMCPRCEGRGTVTDIDLTQLLRRFQVAGRTGVFTIPGYKAGGWMVRSFTECGLLDPDKPIRDYTETEMVRFPHTGNRSRSR